MEGADAAVLESLLRQAVQHHQSGELSQAEDLYRQVLGVAPEEPNAWHLLGLVRLQLGDPAAATALIEQALDLGHETAVFRNSLGLALQQAGRLEEARAALERAVELDPGLYEAHLNLGKVLLEMDQPAVAANVLRSATDLRAGELEPRYLLGNALASAAAELTSPPERQRRYTSALASYEQAIQQDPSFSPAYYGAGYVLGKQWRVEEALEMCRRGSTAASPGSICPWNLLLMLHYTDSSTPEEIWETHRRCGQAYVSGIRRAAHANDRSPDRKLRIGYVSADLRAHSVAFFLEPVLRAHDRSQVEVHCWSNGIPDVVTAQLMPLADAWHDIRRLADEEFAAAVREQGIDILIDLNGHTPGNRLGAFALKPAPVQVTWLGYPDTTGLPTIDYRVTDRWADPPGQTERFHAEDLLRLRHGFNVYTPPQGAVEPGPAPAVANGWTTFGSFNNLMKVTPRQLELWADVLHAIPNSRLLLKEEALDDPGVRERVMAVLSRHGIGAGRVELRGHIANTLDHLAAYREIDVALDTYPYHGTTTTCEALWMGVPVVSLLGLTHASRVGLSLLTRAGLPELATGSEEEYVQACVRLGTDIDGLTRLRAELRDRLRSSSLMDAKGFTASLEEAYRIIWRRWIAT